MVEIKQRLDMMKKHKIQKILRAKANAANKAKGQVKIEDGVSQKEETRSNKAQAVSQIGENTQPVENTKKKAARSVIVSPEEEKAQPMSDGTNDESIHSKVSVLSKHSKAEALRIL